MDGQYNRLVWCINTRTIPLCIGETKMASNNENGIGHLRALVPWLMMMIDYYVEQSQMCFSVKVCLTCFASFNPQLKINSGRICFTISPIPISFRLLFCVEGAFFHKVSFDA